MNVIASYVCQVEIPVIFHLIRATSSVTSLPRIERPKVTSTKKICCKCNSEIGRGKKHTCGKAIRSVEKMVEQLPDAQKDLIASGIIYRKKELENSSSRHIQNVEIPLSTRGKKLNIIVNPTKKPEIKFSEESLDNFRTNYGASANEMKKFTNFLSCNAGNLYIDILIEKGSSSDFGV